MSIKHIIITKIIRTSAKLILLFFLCLFVSCFNSNENHKPGNWECLPGIVLIGYIGENNKPTYPLIINSDPLDTSYYEFVGLDNEKLQKMGFLISNEYFRLSTINPERFILLKDYIAKHNTHKDKNIFNADANTMKIMLYDKCDSIAYSINKEDYGYFSKMIDTLELKMVDKELHGFINYYHEIQTAEMK